MTAWRTIYSPFLAPSSHANRQLGPTSAIGMRHTVFGRCERSECSFVRSERGNHTRPTVFKGRWALDKVRTMNDVSALLKIITTAARDAEALYAHTESGVPSAASLGSHSLDEAFDNVELRGAIRLLEAACEQLCTLLAPPAHTLLNVSSSDSSSSVTQYNQRVMIDSEPACLRLASDLRITDILLNHPNGLNIVDLASKTSPPVDCSKLAHSLRFLATRGCFREGKSK